MPNRLRDAVSPYLRSHADNPVDWQEWGAEAFAEAERRGVPVLVSIGYSTCHWCHVMARESFSDEDLAAHLNERFVAIKVDREEYPDVDASYLSAASAFTPNLGWPLNVFVTPAGQPFYAGTYWPPEPIGEHPAFRQILDAVTDAWQNRRSEVESNAAAVAQALAASTVRERGALPGREAFTTIVQELVAYEDKQFGGFGAAPKFPVATVVSLLGNRGRAGDTDAAALAVRTLDAMAASALRDPVDGGFFRYSTRRDWTDPHYERMLYDNALLLGAYARAGRTEIAEGITGFLIGTLQQPNGGFASAQDSESYVDGVKLEGAYYALDADGRAAQRAPALDGKVLTGWNGLAIENLALAGRLLGRSEWIDAARHAADFLLENHRVSPDSVKPDSVGESSGASLVRASIDGRTSPASATLEDFGMFSAALLELALATGEVSYAVAARDLVESALAGQDFVVPGGADPVLASHGLAIENDPSEGAYPSGQSAMAGAARKLYLLTADRRFLDATHRAMASFAPLAVQRPIAFGAALEVMSDLDADVRQLVVVSDSPGDALSSLALTSQDGVVSVVTAEQGRAFAAAGFELFESRETRGGAATAYYCRDFHCALPITEVQDLAALLDSRD